MLFDMTKVGKVSSLLYREVRWFLPDCCFRARGERVYIESSGVDEYHGTTLTHQVFRGVTPFSECVWIENCIPRV